MIQRTVHRRIFVILVALTVACSLKSATTTGDDLTSPTATGMQSTRGHTSCGDAAAGRTAEKNVDLTHNEAKTEANNGISFVRQIAPLMLSRCSACHGDRDAQSKYSVFSYERMMQPGSSGSPPIVPGSIAESYFFDLVSAEEPDFWMPRDKPRLSEQEIQLLRDWIDSGAKFDGKDTTTPLWQIIPPITYSPHNREPAQIPVTAVAFNCDGKQLAIGALHEIVIIESKSGEVIRRISNVAERTYDLAFHPETGQLVAATGTPGGLGEVRVFDPATGEFVRELARTADVALGVAFDSAGTRIACCGADRIIRIHDFASGEQLLIAQHHSDWVYHVAFNADGSRIVSASRDMTAKVIDAKTGDLVTTYNGHQSPVRDAAFLPNGAQAVSCGDDNKIHIWTTAATGKASAMSESPQDEKKVAEITGFGHDVGRLTVSGDSIFAASADARAHQFLTDSRQHQRVWSVDRNPIYALSVHSSTQSLATGSHDGRVRIWDIASGKLVAEWRP